MKKKRTQKNTKTQNSKADQKYQTIQNICFVTKIRFVEMSQNKVIFDHFLTKNAQNGQFLAVFDPKMVEKSHIFWRFVNRVSVDQKYKW